MIILFFRQHFLPDLLLYYLSSFLQSILLQMTQFFARQVTVTCIVLFNLLYLSSFATLSARDDSDFCKVRYSLIVLFVIFLQHFLKEMIQTFARYVTVTCIVLFHICYLYCNPFCQGSLRLLHGMLYCSIFYCIICHLL